MRCITCKQKGADWPEDERSPHCREYRDAEKHRYFLLNRPPGCATIPDGWYDYEAWMPGRVLNLSQSAMVWHALGWVDYVSELEPHTIWKWELLPADTEARAAYQEWREEERR